MESTEVELVTIVGGGLSGCLAAAQLLRQATRPLEIVLIERRFPFGSGRAFATSLPCHLLNVPAGRMSAYPDDPGHLLRWLQERSREVGPGLTSAYAFLPRLLYGAYVDATLLAASEGSKAKVTRVVGDVVGIDPNGERGRMMVRMADGSRFYPSHAVLALGNQPPSDPLKSAALDSSRRYAPDPWDEHALHDLSPDDTVVTVGSNLTMVDVALALDQLRHRGPILAVSTHGLLPQPQLGAPHEAWTSRAEVAAPRLRGLFRAVRDEMHAADASGIGWRSVMDALRPRVDAIWDSWPDAERLRFLRHVRPYWEVHRHRMAPENAKAISALLDSGRLRVVAGRIAVVTETPDALEVRILRRGTGRQETVRAARVVNCTGPGMDFRRSRDLLVRDLLTRGLARPGPLGLGFDAGSDGALIGANGLPSSTLFTLGPPLKGMRWETTAVPEIRAQAQALATRFTRV
jgi:uncharacterized NAD(P)/FAD-binding protein YdhS